MTDLPLAGLRILIVEDDYYLATDARTIIEQAGGTVIGPFGTVEEARAAIDADGADLAVIDINLGDGPAFDLARELDSANLPFLFATGYDQAAVPDDLKTVVRLEAVPSGRADQRRRKRLRSSERSHDLAAVTAPFGRPGVGR